MRARTLRVSSALRTMGCSASLRIPTAEIFAVGTRKVILSLTKLITNNSRVLPCDFLFFDRNDLADAMRRIDNEFTGLEILTLRRLFRGHSLVCSLTLWLGAAGRLGHGKLQRRLAPGCRDKIG